MKRPLTTSPAAPPLSQLEQPEMPTTLPWRETAPIVAALIAALNIMEASPKAGPAMKAHRSTIRRQGEAAAAVGGPEAMEAVLRQAAETVPDRAERWQKIIVEAWAGLPGWRA